MSTNHPKPKCLLCDEPAREYHHVTGKGPDGTYLDPDSVVGLCRGHHHQAHADLRSQHINTAPQNQPWSALTAAEFRLQRLATFTGRVALVLELDWLATLAEALRRLADDLAAFRQELDQAFPNWEGTITAPPKESAA